MARGRIAEHDYTDSIPVSVEVPMSLHQALKIYCIQHDTTMKYTLHELAIKGLSELGIVDTDTDKEE